MWLVYRPVSPADGFSSARRISEAAAASQRGNTAPLQGAGEDLAGYRLRRPSGSPLRRGRHRRAQARCRGSRGAIWPSKPGRSRFSEPKGGYVFEAPKSGKGRNIRLTQRATAALTKHRKRQLEERLQTPQRQDHGLVFHLNRAFEAKLRRAELPEIRFHDLRHTYATLLPRQGVNPKLVQELLGHADISLTLNVYWSTCSPTWATPPRARWTPRSDRPLSRWCQSGVEEPRSTAQVALGRAMNLHCVYP